MSVSGFLHRHVWRRLPHKWRREALFFSCALAAPRPSRNVASAEPIIVAGTFRAASGLGESARLCHDAIKAAGLKVYGIDLTSALMQPEDFSEFAYDDGKAVEGGGTLILHVNAPLVPLAMLRLGKRAVVSKRIVGYWAWELSKVPRDWARGVPFVHEIWVPSNFTAEAVRPIAGDRPVNVVWHPVAIHAPRHERPQPIVARPFTVLTIFNMTSSFARKNPCLAIRAFQQAFNGDPAVRLIVKWSNGDSFPAGVKSILEVIGDAKNIAICDENLTRAQLNLLYEKADVLLSLHRSEGFGLTIAEAMLRGLPVIATDWSGNRDFLCPETGFPIAYDLVPARDLQGTYDKTAELWADADCKAASATLRMLRHDHLLRETVGGEAAKRSKLLFSRQNYAHKVRELLHL